MGPWYTADVTLLIVNSRELLCVVTKQMHELTPFQLLFRPYHYKNQYFTFR